MRSNVLLVSVLAFTRLTAACGGASHHKARNEKVNVEPAPAPKPITDPTPQPDPAPAKSEWWSVHTRVYSTNDVTEKSTILVALSFGDEPVTIAGAAYGDYP